ncbi:MAG: hypothetical protein WA354_11950 [Terracidiphilus sp.]
MNPRPPAELQIPFDRVTYREGQLLASRDLHDDFDTAQRLRRMHTLFLHNTWGIALGFSVYGQVSDESIHVGPGYAIDSSARELLLSEDLLLPVPLTPVATDLLLVIGYVSDSEFTDLPEIGILCAGTVLDPREERPAFAWRTPDTLNLGVDVPLAHLHVEKGVLTQVPDLTVRRYARRQVRPHIATGVAFAIGRLIADGLTVNTSDAGFAGNPEYFARLDFVGNTALDALAQFGANSAYIASSDSKQFVYAAPELIKFLPGGLALPFAITWVGVEPVTGCEPVSNPLRYFTLAGLNVSAVKQFQLKGAIA